MVASNEKSPSVKLEPVRVNGDVLTTTSADNRYITDKEYHAQRTAVNDMRSSNSSAGRLYDRFLGSIQDPKKFPELQADEMKSLQDSAGRHKVQLGSVGNAVGLEMRANKYDTSFRPSIMVEVNGRKMASDVVSSHLKGSGVEGKTDIPRSEAPGKISGEISFAKSEAVKLVPGAKDNSSWRLVKEDLMATAGTSPAKEAAKAAAATAINDAKTSANAPVTKGASAEVKSVAPAVAAEARTVSSTVAAEVKSVGSKLSGPAKVAVGAVGIVASGIAAAHEPGATIGSVATKIVDDNVVGAETARKGGGLCKVFGEWAGAGAKYGTYAAGMATTGAAVAGGTVTTGVGGVALASVMAPLTVAAADGAEKLGTVAGESSCKSILEGGVLLRQKAGQAAESISSTASEMTRDATSALSKVKTTIGLGA